MRRFLAVALLPIVILLFGCSHNGTIETSLIALEQSVKNTNDKRDLEIGKINRALDEIKKEQANIKMMAEENDRRISQLGTLIASKRPEEKRIEGSITFVKVSTAFISVGKDAGVKLGDIFRVYKNKESKEKIASLKITAVDLDSSSGEIEGKTQDIEAGYSVIRGDAAKELGMIKDRRAVEPLTAAPKDTDSDIQQSAAKELGEINAPVEAEKVEGTVPEALSTEPSETEHERTEDWTEWLMAQTKNTRKAYEKVIKKYPGSDGAKEAQRCLNDPVYAFLITCQQGTEDAFKGFCKTHPSSRLRAIAESYLQFKRKVLIADLAEIRKFIRRNPENPFGLVAMVCVPAVWLKRSEARVGVQISLGEIVRKGLLGGTSNPEKVRKSLWKRFSEPLIAEGVEVALIDENDAVSIASRFTHLLEIEYTEQREETPPNNYSSGSSLQDSAANNLASAISELLFSSGTYTLNATITSTGNNTVIFQNIQDIAVMSPIIMSEVFKVLEASPEVRLAILVFALRNRPLKQLEKEAQSIVTEYLAADH